MVIDDDLNDLILLKNKRMRELAVHKRIGGILTGGHHSIKCRHFWRNVSYVSEEGTKLLLGSDNKGEMFDLLWSAIPQVAHHHVESDYLVGLREQRFLVVWDEIKVVKVMELVHKSWYRKGFGVIIDKPSSHVPIQTIRNGIEKGLVLVRTV